MVGANEGGLTTDTDLPDEVDDLLSGSETLEFERAGTFHRSEESALIPSVNAFDLPLAADGDPTELIPRGMGQDQLEQLIADSRRCVLGFGDADRQAASDLARELSSAAALL